jgi:hypothetical protein
MAKAISKLSDKLSKCSDSLTVNIYDNGYMVEVSGRTKDDDWASAKIMCHDLNEVLAVLEEANEMERD